MCIRDRVKAQWGKMIEDYLHQSQMLRAVFLLVDIRHAPSGNDRLMYDWLKHYGYDIIIAATKKDKIKRSQIQKQLSLIKNTLKLAPEDRLIAFSGETKDGVEELWEELEKLIGYEKTEVK